MITKYQIPDYNSDASDEMVEWLHKMEQEWDGDECGIIIWKKDVDDEDPYVGGPGDYVCEENGIYWIENVE